jgi:cell division septal protein FtsQ
MRAAQRKVLRDQRASARKRSSRLRTGFIAAVVLAAIVGCGVLYNSSVFAVKRIEVVGAVHLTTQHVLTLAAVPADATLIRFPADAVAASVSADPWVESVAVSRVFPDGMRIRVTERVPVAVVSVPPASWLIDRSGSVIATASAVASGTLPVIVDVPGLDLKAGRRTTSEPLLNAVNVITSISSGLLKLVGTVSAPTIDGTTLLTKDHVEIVMGQAVNVATKDQLARTILSQQRGKVVSIDVRTTDRPTWRGLK